MTYDIQELTDVAHALADAARQAILPYFRGAALATENKLEGGYDPVTVADRAAEQAMRAVLAARRPQDAILGEEFGSQPGTSGLTWVLDPIDGTRGFVAGHERPTLYRRTVCRGCGCCTHDWPAGRHRHSHAGHVGAG